MKYFSFFLMAALLAGGAYAVDYEFMNFSMTSNTAPSPYVTNASQIDSSTYQAFKAFDGSKTAATGWISKAATGLPANISIYLGSGNSSKLSRYIITPQTIPGSYGYAPQQFKVYGSNDNLTWTLLDYQNSITYGAGVDYTFNLTNNTGSYTYYLWQVTGVSAGTFTSIVELSLYRNTTAASSSFFSVTARDNLTGGSINTFNATINGTFYNTSNGTIVTSINNTASSALVNITADSTNYLTSNNLNINTSATVQLNLTPYATVIASDYYDNSSISSFTVEYNSTNYTGSAGTARVPVTTTTYNLTVYSTNYFTRYFTNSEGNRGTTFNASMWQAEVYFNASAIITNAPVTGFTVTTVNQTNNSNPPYLKLKAGTYTFNFSKTGYFGSTLTYTVNASNNFTATFANVSQYALNVTAYNRSSGLSINTFTATINGTSGYTTSASTTTGTVYLPAISENYTVTVNASNFATGSNVTAVNTSGYTNVSVYLYPYPSVIQVYAYDEDTGVLITTTNLTFTLSGSTGDTVVTTTSGSYMFNNTVAGAYSFKAQGGNYTQHAYNVTVGEQTYQTLNVYLSNSSSTVSFTVVDADVSTRLLEGAIVSMSRSVNGSIVTVESRTSDISGAVQFYYVPGARYRFTASMSGYTPKTFTLDPVQYSSYTIRMDRLNDLSNSQDYSAVGVVYSTDPYDTIRFFEDQTNNFTYTIASPTGALTGYYLLLTYPGGTQSFYDTNAQGGTFTTTVNITGADLFDVVNVTYAYNRTDEGQKNFTAAYIIMVQAAPLGTFAANQNRTFGLGDFDRIVIVSSIALVMGGFVFLILGSAGAILVMLLVFGGFFLSGFISVWYLLIPGLVGFMLLARGDR